MSNAKPVVMHIQSNIVLAGADDQNMDLMTEGKYYEKLGAHYFIYEETEVSGMAGDKTSIKVKDNKVTMHRYGQNNSELTFEVGRRYESLYKTPYGNFDMEILASEVSFEVSENGSGYIHLVYALSVKGMGESKTTMDIRVRAAGE